MELFLGYVIKLFQYILAEWEQWKKIICNVENTYVASYWVSF